MMALGWMNVGAAMTSDAALASVVSAILVVVGRQSIGADIALAGLILDPIFFFVAFNVIRLATHWYGVKYGYDGLFLLVVAVLMYHYHGRYQEFALLAVMIFFLNLKLCRPCPKPKVYIS